MLALTPSITWSQPPKPATPLSVEASSAFVCAGQEVTLTAKRDTGIGIDRLEVWNKVAGSSDAKGTTKSP